MIPDDGEDIVFLGGKDYLPLFQRLSKDLKAQKKVFFNTRSAPSLAKGFVAERFPTTIRTNWHYACAKMLAQAKVD